MYDVGLKEVAQTISTATVGDTAGPWDPYCTVRSVG